MTTIDPIFVGVLNTSSGELIMNVDRNIAHSKRSGSAIEKRSQSLLRRKKPLLATFQLVPFHDSMDRRYPSCYVRAYLTL